MSTSKKSRKNDGNGGEDRISNLPRSVISNILSLMSTKDAVRTSVLSKDWEYNWASIFNIDIDDSKLYSKNKADKDTTFVNFVERILLHSQNIKSFNLTCCEKYDSNRMTACISAVLRRNVESLKVNYPHNGIILPRSLLNCTSLRKLELKLPCIFKVPVSNCFYSNLTNLYLHRVEFVNECSNSNQLIFTFPVLEKFELKSCKLLNVKLVEIYAPRLTKFTSATPFGTVGLSDYLIKIHAARPFLFLSFCDLPENCVVIRSQVGHAVLRNYWRKDDLELLKKIGLQVQLFLEGISSSLKNLVISSDIAKSQLRVPITRFDVLVALAICTSCNVETLLVLLKAAPSLKSLFIDMNGLDVYDYDGIEFIPSCIVSYLHRVRFYNFTGEKPQLDLAMFLLKNAIHLKKLYLYSSVSSKPSDVIIDQLLRFPKASSCLAIIVQGPRMCSMQTLLKKFNLEIVS
ncbi:hypothetical protein ACJIZ3_023334 [Penstemon smallii]|uniref:F-box domain-containing protein n=1 Tax=Penstemon smallii TaxID=265156 RepID=A0ABD3TRQ8_9LAMI